MDVRATAVVAIVPDAVDGGDETVPAASSSQFRAGPPPSLSSRKWARDFNEIKAYGSANSTARSPEQTAVAQFWNANAVNQSNQGFQDVAGSHGMDSVSAARLLAMGNLIDSDALIACWDSKYHYLFWRPVMAIRNADIDGNAATQADPAWTPLLTTPNHPEYPAAHTCLTAPRRPCTPPFWGHAEST